MVRQPVRLGSAEVVTSASIGISVYPTDVAGIDELLASADAAMYRAKEQGADRFHFYTMAMRVLGGQPARARERAAQGGGARRVRACTTSRRSRCAAARSLGMEALLRWQHPRAAS